MRRLPWDIVLALLAGLGAGLVYAWMISPLAITNASPNTLRAEFKDQYRAAIAAAFAANGNMPRAQARLALLQDPDPAAALNAQAQQMLAQGDPDRAAELVAYLGRAIQGGAEDSVRPGSPVTEPAAAIVDTSSTGSVDSLDPLILTGTPLASIETSTPLGEATLPVPAPATPRPTQTPIPSPAAPFKLTGQDEICDPNLPDGLLQVVVQNSNRRQIAGMAISITWEGGAEQFFTGLKPELGSGYGDFIMTPGITYTLQLPVGSDIAAGLSAPTCQTANGEPFHGGLKLTFQQP